MRKPDQLAVKEITDLLHKGWMSHDGMWFYHCQKEFGIETANKLNKAAIRSLAPLEMKRLKRLLGVEKVETFEEFKHLFSCGFELLIADFMNARMTFPEKNVFHWEFAPHQCFAYKGMQNIGVIEDYECGVVYRVACWIDSLGIPYSVSPRVFKCLMLPQGSCAGDFKLELK
ncbi:MAG: hypothetical protein EHM27_15290 [Deltaproteobacteria bacterium]|nr:MAG: hypothetical protein EHM27_15290 [Deltaproteobacteria bacterium]